MVLGSGVVIVKTIVNLARKPSAGIKSRLSDGMA